MVDRCKGTHLLEQEAAREREPLRFHSMRREDERGLGPAPCELVTWPASKQLHQRRGPTDPCFLPFRLPSPRRCLGSSTKAQAFLKPQPFLRRQSPPCHFSPRSTFQHFFVRHSEKQTQAPFNSQKLGSSWLLPVPTGTIFPIVFSRKQWKRKGNIYLRSPPSSQKSKTERLKSKPIHLPRVVFKSEICLWEQLWVELWIEAVCYFNHKVSSREEERWKWGWHAEAPPPQVRRDRRADGRTLKPTFPKLEVKQLWNIPEEEDKTLTVFFKKRHVGLIVSEGKPSSELTWGALGLGQKQVTPADSLLHAAESLLGVKGQWPRTLVKSSLFLKKHNQCPENQQEDRGWGGNSSGLCC